MARRKTKLKRHKIPRLPNISVNIDGRRASIRTLKGKTVAKYGKYTGSVNQSKGRININFKKKKPKGFLESLF